MHQYSASSTLQLAASDDCKRSSFNLQAVKGPQHEASSREFAWGQHRHGDRLRSWQGTSWNIGKSTSSKYVTIIYSVACLDDPPINADYT